MRFRIPDDCAGVSHAGVFFERSRDGLIEADEAAAVHLAPHGIVALPPDEKPEKTSKVEGRRASR